MSENTPDPLAYSIRDAIRVTSLGRSTLLALVKSGALRTTKVGQRRLIPAAALRALVDPSA